MSSHMVIADVCKVTACRVRPSHGVDAVDFDRTRRDRKQRREKLQQRRPSAAVWPDDPDTLPRGNVEIHARKSDRRSESLLKSSGTSHASHFKWTAKSVSPSTRTG